MKPGKFSGFCKGPMGEGCSCKLPGCTAAATRLLISSIIPPGCVPVNPAPGMRSSIVCSPGAFSHSYAPVCVVPPQASVSGRVSPAVSPKALIFVRTGLFSFAFHVSACVYAWPLRPRAPARAACLLACFSSSARTACASLCATSSLFSFVSRSIARAKASRLFQKSFFSLFFIARFPSFLLCAFFVRGPGPAHKENGRRGAPPGGHAAHAARCVRP